jgi:hypothetical protein
MVYSKELCDIIIEFYNFKKHTWYLMKINNVIDYKHNEEADMIVYFILNGGVEKITLPYGRILNYSILNSYAEINGDVAIIQHMSKSPIIYKNFSNIHRFKVLGYNMQQRFDEKLGGEKAEWLHLTTETLKEYQVRQVKYSQKSVGQCLVEVKQKGLSFLRENLWICRLMKVF